MPDWQRLPLALIPLDRVVFPCHDLDPEHVHSATTGPVSVGPIHVERLLDGDYFVHDGRHRTLRARTLGHASIWARVA
jgi:hypothetical protein